MNANEFIALNISYGDRVLLTLKSEKKIECFFGGYKTWGIIEKDLDYIMPVFYAPKKNGEMGNRPALGPGYPSPVPYSNIEKVEKL